MGMIPNTEAAPVDEAEAGVPGTSEDHGKASSRTDAVWLLARRLHWKTEHLDPVTTEEVTWDLLTDLDREFYRACVEAIFDERKLSRLALK